MAFTSTQIEQLTQFFEETLGGEPETIAAIISILGSGETAGLTVPQTLVEPVAVTAVATGVESPANSSYTQADQTAEATAVLALITDVTNLKNELTSLHDKLVTAGIIVT